MTDISINLRRLAAPVLILAVTAFSGCDNGNAAARDPNAPAETSLAAGAAPAAKDEAFQPWFEPLLVRSLSTSVTVALAPVPDGSGFFLLGRNGDLHYHRTPLEAFPLTAKGLKDAGRTWKPQPVKVKIDNTFARGDLGSIGMALDPEFTTNKLLYVWYSDQKDEFVCLDRFSWSDDPARVLASRVNVIRVSRRQPPAPYHMGGIVQFLPDGTLLIAIGDAERRELSQDKKDLNGKLIRILPRKGPEGGYDVPPDNPFVDDPSYLPEILAIGLRAPFRGFLCPDGRLIFGDVGSTHEEIDVWDPSVRDFGWGRAHLSDGPAVDPGVTPPILWWTPKQDFSGDDPHYNGETRVSAGVGVVYEPGAKDRYQGHLTGHLIFFDIMRGWIRAGAWTSAHDVPQHRHIGHLQFVSHMLVGADGYIYGTSFEKPNMLWRMRSNLE